MNFGTILISWLLLGAACSLPVCVPAGFVPREIRSDSPGAMAHLSKVKLLMPAPVVLATIVLIWSDTPLWETRSGDDQSGVGGEEQDLHAA